MFLIKFLLLELVSIPLLVLNPFVTALALLFTPREANQLPAWARWWDNSDPEGDGLNGYYQWKIDYPDYTGFKARWLWLQRNPLNWFSVYIMGIRYPAQDYIRTDYKWFTEGKVGNNDNPGVRLSIIRNDDETKILYFEFYLIYKYLDTKCVRIRLGHKLGEIGESLAGEQIGECFVINPFMTYRGN